MTNPEQLQQLAQIKSFKNELFAAAKTAGFSDYELYYAASTSFEAKVLNQDVSEYKNTAPHGFTFRGLVDGKMGYAYSEQIDNSVIEFIIDAAKANAQVKESTDESLFAGSPSYPEGRPISPALDKPTPEQKIAWAKELEAHAKTVDPRVIAVDYCFIASATGQVYIANSHGLDLHHTSGRATSYIGVRVSENDTVKVGFEVFTDHDFENYDPKRVAEKGVAEALKKLGATSIPTGDYPVIIENEAMVSLLGVYVGNFFGETVQKGFSLLKGKLGEAIANPNITIHDNISHPKSLAHNTFDSEGVAVRDKVLVDKGVLKTFLYNLKAANAEGCEPTGNGYKGGFKEPVMTSVNNLFIEPGETAIDALLGDFSGVLIKDFMGLHAGANAVSGDFSLQSSGFLYENGKLVKPVEQITLAGNFYDLLKNVQTVADDIYFPAGSAVGAPSLLVGGLKISGEGEKK